VGWLVWWQGYKQGRKLVLSVLSGGFMKNWITRAQVLGNFIMGALTVSFVNLSTPVAIRIGGTVIGIQNILDQIIPNLLPVLAVLLAWWLLSKKKVSPVMLLGAIIFTGILLSYPIWPGVDAVTNEVIRVGVFK
jgi:mannose/fructose/N-acetylgalactosamine-specific phosphotransferase system component IID